MARTRCLTGEINIFYVIDLPDKSRIYLKHRYVKWMGEKLFYESCLKNFDGLPVDKILQEDGFFFVLLYFIDFFFSLKYIEKL